MNKANEVNLIVEKLVKILWSEDTHGHGKAAIEELMKVCEIIRQNLPKHYREVQRLAIKKRGDLFPSLSFLPVT